MKIDADALKAVLDRYAEEKLAREIREIVVYGLPPEFGQLYKDYLEEVDRKHIAMERRIRYVANALLYAMGFGCIVYGLIGILK